MARSKLPAHLTIRNGIYTFKRRVPKDAIDVFGGKAVVQKSLGTADYRIALSRLAEAVVDFDTRVRDARSKGTPERVHSRTVWAASEVAPTDSEIEAYARWWLANHVDAFRHRLGENQDKRTQLDMSVDRASLEAAYRKGEVPLVIQWQLKEMAERGGWHMPVGSGAYTRAAEVLLQARLDALHQLEQRLSRPKASTSMPELFGEERYKEDAAAAPVTLARAAQGFLKERRVRWGDAKTEQIIERRLQVVVEALGSNRLARDVTKADCVRIRDEVLRRLPPRLVLDGGDIREKIDEADARGLDVISPTTQNLHIDVMSGFFGWCAQNGMRHDNPARGLRVAQRPRSARRPFTLNELSGLFGGLPQAVVKRRQYVGGRTPIARDPHVWVPLIALFTGMRLQEICALARSEVVNRAGILCFEIRERSDEGRLLKTPQSARVIPVHRQLVELGFEELLVTDGRLFPHLVGGARGFGAEPFGKWINRYIRSLGFPAKEAVFHSFRHNFRDQLREAPGDRDVKLALGGWEDNSTAELYGLGFSAAKLNSVLQQVRYDGLDLTSCRSWLAGIDG